MRKKSIICAILILIIVLIFILLISKCVQKDEYQINTNSSFPASVWVCTHKDITTGKSYKLTRAFNGDGFGMLTVEMVSPTKSKVMLPFSYRYDGNPMKIVQSTITDTDKMCLSNEMQVFVTPKRWLVVTKEAVINASVSYEFKKNESPKLVWSGEMKAPVPGFANSFVVLTVRLFENGLGSLSTTIVMANKSEPNGADILLLWAYDSNSTTKGRISGSENADKKLCIAPLNSGSKTFVFDSKQKELKIIDGTEEFKFMKKSK